MTVTSNKRQEDKYHANFFKAKGPPFLAKEQAAHGAILHIRKRIQGKDSALCCFAVLICAVCVCREVVEVVALLGFIQRGLCDR